MLFHPGQEHCCGQSGEIVFHVGDVQYRLEEGDGIVIDSQLPRRDSRPTEARVVIIRRQAD